MKGDVLVIDNELSWIDFMFFGLIEFMVYLTDTQIYSFQNCEKLIPFYAHMSDLPRLGVYLASDDCIDQEYEYYIPVTEYPYSETENENKISNNY